MTWYVYTDDAYWYDDDACRWVTLTQAFIYQIDLKNITESLFSKSKIELIECLMISTFGWIIMSIKVPFRKFSLYRKDER